jgi:hypothetical protein
MHFRVLSILISLFTAACYTADCYAADPVAKVNSLPGIVELRIVDPQSVYLKSSQNMMLNKEAYGGFQADRHYIEAETGQIKVDPHARKPNEITIKAGEEASNVTRFGGDTFKLIRVEGDLVTFRHIAVSRNGKNTERDIVVSPYQTPP